MCSYFSDVIATRAELAGQIEAVFHRDWIRKWKRRGEREGGLGTRMGLNLKASSSNLIRCDDIEGVVKSELHGHRSFPLIAITREEISDNVYFFFLLKILK